MLAFYFQKEYHRNNQKCRRRQPHYPLTSLPEEPHAANNSINIICLETRIIDLHFAADSMGLSSSFNFFLVGSVKRFFPQECVSAVQGHPKSVILVRIESEYATSY